MAFIRNIIWDLDGTLFDTYPAILEAFSRTLDSFDIPVNDALIRGHARNSLTAYLNRVVENYGLEREVFMQRYMENYYSNPLDNQPPFDGVREVCAYIQSIEGVNAIATHRSRESAQRLIDHFDLAEYFCEMASVEDGYPLKPDPAMMIHLMQSCQLVPPETMAVGDRILDVLAGKAAGLATCLYGGAEGFSEVDLVTHDYRELLEYLQRRTRGQNTFQE